MNLERSIMTPQKKPTTKRAERATVLSPDQPKITVLRDGPYRITGGVPLTDQVIMKDADGFSAEWRTGKEYPVQEEYSLCRCGQAKTAPFCDGSHGCGRTDLTETAEQKPCPGGADWFEGPFLNLADCTPLCASAKFCDRAGGIWNLTLHPDSPEAESIAITEAGNCPSGRLVIRNTGNTDAIEQHFEPSVGLIEYPEHAGKGPVWVRGMIPVESADGKCYAPRNRVTLCRCGKSANKPFCDSSHLELLSK
jgi:CDGSH-type Zn-finger protein